MNQITTTVAEQTPAAKPRMAPDQMVAKFVALRDKIAEMKKRHTDELAPYNLAMGTLEAWLLDVLNTNHATSMRFDAGTPYTTTRTSVKVDEWSTVLGFIREHEAWELLEARVNKTALEAIIGDTGTNIPGVSVSRELVLNVRRG
jgi:hypothetical protein